MTLLWTDSFDVRDATLKYDSFFFYPGTLASLGNNEGTSTLTGRYGTGIALGVRNYASQGLGFFKRAITPSAQVFLGAAIQNGSGADSHLFRLYADTGAILHLTLRLAGGVLSVYRGDPVSGGTLLAQSAASTLPDNTWGYVEMSATVADAGGNVQVRLNSNATPVINFTGDTRNAGTSTNIDAFMLANPGSVFHYFDDLYVCNALGSVNNTFMGEIRVNACLPTGAGSSTQFTPSTGSNWDNVNDVPPVTSTFNSSSTSGQRDTYALADLPGTAGTVLGVQEVLLASKADAGLAQVKSAVKSGASVYYGSNINLTANALTYTNVRETDPATSTAWAVSAVNALEYGAEVV